MSANEDNSVTPMFQSQSNLGNIPQQRKMSNYHLILSEPMPHDVQINNKKGGGVDVILYGVGCKEHIQAKMSSTRFMKKIVSVDSTGYLYPINVSVKQNC